MGKEFIPRIVCWTAIYKGISLPNIKARRPGKAYSKTHGNAQNKKNK
jgi:hypothetical protein